MTMNDLRSPLEDRPYRPAAPQYSQQSYMIDANSSSFSSKFKSLRQHRFFPLGSVITAVLIFGIVISYAYNQGSQSGVNATTPVVQASNEDYKSKPANPGGMDVPFQDAVVFDQLQSKQTANAGNKVESLLPSPEQPAAATTTASTAAPANTNTAAATTNNNAATTATAATTAAATTAATAEQDAPVNSASTTASASMEEGAPAAAATPATAASAEITKPAATKPAKTASTTTAKKMASIAPASTTPAAKIESGSYRIQLGAFHDETAAKAAWNKLKGQYSSQLASVTPAFPKADLGAKGTFYRVQGVNLSKASADSICSRLNAVKSGSCIVAK
jgi:cell division septation protein DedD